MKYFEYKFEVYYYDIWFVFFGLFFNKMWFDCFEGDKSWVGNN